jgi:DNA primase
LREALFAYLESRGVSSKLASKVGIGYCTEGPLWGYLIFPVLEGGELVYWQARRFKNREPKFRNPPLTKKADWLYVLGASKHPTHAVVVESIFNALALGIPRCRWLVCAALGKAVSDVQLVKLMEHHSIQEVTLALDDDAWREQVGIARRMAGYFHVVRLARVPNGCDVSALGRERAWQAIFAADVYQPERHLALLHDGSSS